MTLVRFNRPVGFDLNVPRVLNRTVNRVRPEVDWTPSADVAENEKEFQLVIELPGLEKKDIELSFKDGVLTVKGQKKNSREETGSRYYFTERPHGKFERNFRFAVDIADDQIKANFKNGVLTVTVPKAPEAQPAKVEIR